MKLIAPKNCLFRNLSSICLLMALSLSVNAQNVGNSKAELLYVATDGNDSWSGTVDKSLATLEGARAKVREKIAAGLSAPVTVVIRGGEYELIETVVFSHEDSGTKEFPSPTKRKKARHRYSPAARG